MYGAIAGIDIIGTKSIFGLEAEFSDSQVSSSETDVLVVGDRATISTGRDLYFGVRAGARISQSAWLYAKAGYTNARVVLTYKDSTGTESDHTDRDGVRFGLGAEAMVGNNLRVRGEVRRSEYKALDTGAGFDIDASRTQFVAGVAVAF